jgi:glucose-6-phosphate isomerase
VIKKNITKKNNLNRKSIPKLTKNFQKIIKEIKESIENSNNTFNVLSDNYKFNFKIKELRRFSKFNNLVIIGVGGSILGSEAIYEFLKKKIKKKIYFFDDINEQKISKFKKEVNVNKTVFLIISKSGNTIETLSNFFSLKIIEKVKKNIIIISEKKDNILYSLSKKFNLFYVEHKDYIGGRYSVLSEVGIIPAYLMGLNISKLRKNLKKYLINKDVKFLQDSTTKLANILQQKKETNLVFLNYSPELEKFLYWCQQLIAESLGKNKKGFFPVISNVPKDHHSLLQLYLDGPRDKLFHIFSLETDIKEKINTKKYTNQINYLHNKSLNKVKIAQKNALIKSFKKYKIPFREFKIKQLNEQTLGELFSYYVLETAIVGKLIGVNPFNQPAVEQVKIYTKKLLN